MTELIFYFLLSIFFCTTILFLFLYLRWRCKYKKLLKKSLNNSSENFELMDPSSFLGASSGNELEDALMNSLHEMFENDKVYVDSNLSLSDLAKRLGVSRTLLSRTINTVTQRNFPTLLNEYRVKEAVRLLKDEKFQNYKMEIIAEMCGYRNRQVFHSAFKRCVGVTPIQFREMTKEEAK